MNRWLLRFALLLVVVVLLLGFSVPAGFVAAQEEPGWHTFYYDLTLDMHDAQIGIFGCGGSPPAGQWASGVGFSTRYEACQDAVPGQSGYVMRVHWTRADLLPSPVRFFKLHGVQASGFNQRFTLDNNVDGTNIPPTWRFGGYLQWDEERDYSNFWWTQLENGATLTAVSGEYYGLECEIEPGGCGGGGGDITMPLASEDQEDGWGLFDLQSVQDADDSIEEDFLISDLPYTVYGFSETANAKVSSVANGTVIDIQPHTGSKCGGASESLQRGVDCSVFVPAFLTDDEVAIGFNTEVVDSWIVTIEDQEEPELTYSYLVADVEVAIGDTVVAGCVLGRTVRLKAIPIGITAYFPDKIRLAEDPPAGVDFNGQIGDRFTSYASGGGVTTVVAKMAGEPVSLYPLLSAEPDLSSCAESSLTNCTLENPDLQSNGGLIDGWNVTQGRAIEGGGVHLGPAGSMYQQNIAIRGDISYTLTVLARVTTPIDSFYPLRLQVGSEVTTQNITEGRYQRLTWTFAPMGETDLSLVGVFNQTDFVFNSEVPVEVDILYICLSPDTASVTPGACVFVNNSFDASGTGWLDAGNVSFSSGQAALGDGAIIDHATPILLYPIDDENPASYTIVAVVRLNASSAYTGQSLKQVEIKYRYPESPDVFESLGVIDSTLVGAEGRNLYDGSVNTEHAYVFSDTFDIATFTSGLFSFGVLVTDTEGFIKGIRIDSLCLKANTDDGSFPGFPGDGGFDPPFIENCSIVPTPIDNNISSWTFYHWKNLNRFFNCTLMIVLNDMAETIDTAWRTTRLFMRWCVVLVNRVGDWFTSFLWWLGGHLRNIAYGNVTTVFQSGDSNCHDLFCFLGGLTEGVFAPLVDQLGQVVNLLLALVTQAANLLFSVILGMINLFLGFMVKLLGFLGLAQSLLGSLITAYNTATPIPIPGMPDCVSNPRSGPFCVAIWILDNTIFSGRGQVIIPITVALGYIHLLLWVVAELRNTVMNAGQTT